MGSRVVKDIRYKIEPNVEYKMNKLKETMVNINYI
jgi:hypothetical protein